MEQIIHVSSGIEVSSGWYRVFYFVKDQNGERLAKRTFDTRKGAIRGRKELLAQQKDQNDK